MNDAFSQFQHMLGALTANIPFLLFWAAILLGVQILNWACRYRLNVLGLYPRSWHGFIGIFVSPFLHGNFGHLLFNAIPLFVLADFILIGGKTLFYSVSLFIIFFSGLGVWLFGRRAIHIGASGLVMGYFGYLLFNAYLHPSFIAIVLGAVCIYYFSGLLLSLVPTDVKTSWEGHVFGFIAGLAASYFMTYNPLN